MKKKFDVEFLEDAQIILESYGHEKGKYNENGKS